MAKYLDKTGVQTLWSKIKVKDEAVLTSAKSYATSQDEAVLTSAKSYTDEVAVTKQNILTAGEGIEIENNVISATATGTSGSSKMYYHKITVTSIDDSNELIISAINPDSSPIKDADGVSEFLLNSAAVNMLCGYHADKYYKVASWALYSGNTLTASGNTLTAFYKELSSKTITDKYMKFSLDGNILTSYKITDIVTSFQ